MTEGQLSERDYNNFNMFWDAFYSKNLADEFYVYSVGSLPRHPPFRLMIRVLDLIGYDSEELVMTIISLENLPNLNYAPFFRNN